MHNMDICINNIQVYACVDQRHECDAFIFQYGGDWGNSSNEWYNIVNVWMSSTKNMFEWRCVRERYECNIFIHRIYEWFCQRYE